MGLGPPRVAGSHLVVWEHECCVHADSSSADELVSREAVVVPHLNHDLKASKLVRHARHCGWSGGAYRWGNRQLQCFELQAHGLIVDRVARQLQTQAPVRLCVHKQACTSPVSHAPSLPVFSPFHRLCGPPRTGRWCLCLPLPPGDEPESRTHVTRRRRIRLCNVRDKSARCSLLRTLYT